MKLENNNTESWKLPLYKIFSDEEDDISVFDNDEEEGCVSSHAHV